MTRANLKHSSVGPKEAERMIETKRPFRPKNRTLKDRKTAGENHEKLLTPMAGNLKSYRYLNTAGSVSKFDTSKLKYFQ